MDLTEISGRMTINGRNAGAGVGGDIMGHPFEALAWLANLFAGRGQTLRAGAFVLLGSVVETRWVAAGDIVDVKIDRLGAARAKFE
jgi:2-keto-4-pentenoate hydratase